VWVPPTLCWQVAVGAEVVRNEVGMLFGFPLPWRTADGLPPDQGQPALRVMTNIKNYV